MNAKKLIAAVTVFAATGSVFAAQTYPYVDFSGVQSTRSRAEVIAELKDAQAQDNYVVGGQEYTSPDSRFASSKTRAQVMAELQQAQEDGSYALAHQEFEGQLPLVNDGDAGTRLARNEGQTARTN